MTPKEIAILLVKHGINNQKSSLDSYTDANSEPNIRACGNGKIANSLEFLSDHDIVSDVLPIHGASGMGFSYLLNPQVVQEILKDSAALQRIEALFEIPATETSSEITNLLERCESSHINEVYSQDLIASLTELKTCFSQNCYIACLALSGKILEICLKQLLFDNDKKYREEDTIAGLLGNVRHNIPAFYLDESLSNVGEIIRKNRNSAVHATGRIPVPSREQTMMVIYGVVDTVNRVIVKAE